MMAVCERRGWDYATFRALPRQEQTDLLAREYQRQEAIGRALEASRTDDGKLSADVITARMLVELARF
jgi:hypothetical protein